MKIDQLIVQYLYQNKKVILQDIGTFSVSEDITIPTDIEKDTVLPENAFQFKYDPKAGVDEGLINYIIENTRKIRPLATSDLESFVMLNKQFLNIGKPLVLEGLGTLQKINDGSYTFSQSNTSHVVLKEAPKVVTEKLIEKISFATPDKQVSEGRGKWLLYGLIGFLLIGGAGATGYYFITKNKSNTNDNPVVTTKETTNKEKTENNNTTDTSVQLNPVSTVTTVVNTKDSNTFYIVEKQYYTLAAAAKREAQLKSYGDKVLLVTNDSIMYRIKIAFRNPITDTLRIKDSIAIHYGTKGRSYVELP